MNKLLVAAMFSSLLSLNAFAATDSIRVGSYAQKNYVVDPSIETKKECQSKGGEWLEDDQICGTRHDNTVKIEKAEKDYKVTIETVSSGNGHGCGFEEKGVLNKEGNAIVSTVKVLDYRTDKEEICVVTVKSKNTLFSKAVTVDTNGKCHSEYCGSNAYGLEIEKAKKVK